MTGYHIPPFRIDPKTLPPPLLTSEPGSFAHNTLAVRLPRIILDTLAGNQFPEPVRAALQELYSELTSGHIRRLTEDTPDREFWNEISSDHIGRSWLEVPWYWAETFFYRRMLEATRYFHAGPTYMVDPYRAVKLTELAPDVAPRAAAAALRDLPGDANKRLEALLYSSLWGNRVDLSYRVPMEGGREERLEDERKNLLVDDFPRLWDAWSANPPRHIALVADNAGTEVTMDLALLDWLLESGLAANVTLFLKPQPFFVSDAMPTDVEDAIAALSRGEPEAQALARRIGSHREGGRMHWQTHWFFPTCLFYFQMPDDLAADFSRMDWVILKGDVNYRRLLGDAHWDPTASFERATAYFPAPLVALRTLKAETIAGLPAGMAERLRDIDPGWMVNGRRGIVQARL